MRISFAVLSLLVAAAPALAEERDFCGDRPGLGTPACTVDPGHLQAELGGVDWTLDKQPDARMDTILAGDLQLRYGVGDNTETRFGWTAYGHARTRDRTTGVIDRMSGTGDVSLGIKQNLMHPDGSGTAIAILPEVTLPTGGKAIGAGTWGASLRVPADFELTKALQLAFTPEVDAMPDEDRHGRHLAFGNVVGLADKLSDDLTATLEYSIVADHDPEGHTTDQLASLSVAYQTSKDTQFDAGAVAGLSHSAPDAELYFGISRRF